MSNKFDDFFPRIEYVVEKFYGGNVTEFAKKAGMKRQNYYNMRKEYKKEGKEPNVGFSILKNIFDTSDVNPTWLLTGRGEPKRDANPALVEEKYDEYEALLSDSRNADTTSDEKIEVASRQLKVLLDFLKDDD